MGFLWGLFKTIIVGFAVIIALLVVIDGTLVANVFRKQRP